MCKYEKVCPSFDERNNVCQRCEKGHIDCIPYLLEDICRLEEMDYDEMYRKVYY